MEKNADGTERRPYVGVGVLILNDKEEVLLALRLASHGTGEWSFPGGHLEFGEKVFETAKREVKEETNLDIEEFQLISVCDEMRYIETNGKHYLNVSVLGKYQGGNPQTMEPDKCAEWRWFALDELPDNLFEPTALTLRNFKNKVIYQP
jgi:8-oxo-dGTP diphosphatase